MKASFRHWNLVPLNAIKSKQEINVTNFGHGYLSVSLASQIELVQIILSVSWYKTSPDLYGVVGQYILPSRTPTIIHQPLSFMSTIHNCNQFTSNSFMSVFLCKVLEASIEQTNCSNTNHIEYIKGKTPPERLEQRQIVHTQIY